MVGELVATVIAAEAVFTAVVAWLSYVVSRRIPNRALSLLSLAFSFLTAGELIKLFAILSGPARLLLPSGAAVEMVGFFLLALSHVYSIRRAALAMLAILPYPESTVYSLAKGISLYLILYVAVETSISYIETRYKESLLSSSGLYLLFAAQAISAFTTIGLANPIIGESLSLAGYALLAIPGILAYFAG